MKLGSIRGIPLRVHVSFLIILPFLAWAFGRALEQAAELADVPAGALAGPAIAWGLLVAVALFASVLVHELAHSLYAIRSGGRVKDITLFMLGGVSRISEPPRTPRHEAVMAAVGPLTSFALAAGFYGVHVALRGTGSFNLQFAFFHVAVLNVALGVFNLLPAFPLDGGRVVRGLLAGRMGYLRATRLAATLGKGFAILFGLAGLAGGNLILVLIAFVVWTGAAAEATQARVEETLRPFRVGDVMSPAPGAIPAGASARAAVDWLRQARRVSAPVAEAGERPLGIVSMRAIERMPRERLDDAPVREVVTPTPSLSPEDEVTQVLRLLAELRVPELPVVDPADPSRVVGTIGTSDVTRAVELSGLDVPPRGPRGWPRRRQSPT